MLYHTMYVILHIYIYICRDKTDAFKSTHDETQSLPPFRYLRRPAAPGMGIARGTFGTSMPPGLDCLIGTSSFPKSSLNGVVKDGC